MRGLTLLRPILITGLTYLALLIGLSCIASAPVGCVESLEPIDFSPVETPPDTWDPGYDYQEFIRWQKLFADLATRPEEVTQ